MTTEPIGLPDMQGSPNVKAQAEPLERFSELHFHVSQMASWVVTGGA